MRCDVAEAMEGAFVHLRCDIVEATERALLILQPLHCVASPTSPGKLPMAYCTIGYGMRW